MILMPFEDVFEQVFLFWNIILENMYNNLVAISHC